MTYTPNLTDELPLLAGRILNLGINSIFKLKMSTDHKNTNLK